MRLFCESVVTELLPAIRAIITRELMSRYGLNQVEVAQKLGITQPAVSNYKRELRGRRVKKLLTNEQFVEMIKVFTNDLAVKNLSEIQKNSRFCEICEKVFQEENTCKIKESILTSSR